MLKYKRSPIHTSSFGARSRKMPSNRRIKVFVLLIFIFVATVLLFSGSLRQQRELDFRGGGDFYEKTKNALNNKKLPNSGGVMGSNDDEEVARKMAERLREAAQVAKDNANAKAPKPDPPSSVIGKGSSAEGSRDERGVGRKKTGNGDVQEPIVEESQEDHDVKVELNIILKKSPIIIFSKSYCPHSKRAKGILLDKYIIEPAPFVVELDLHPLGLNLQSRLEELTGRRTVPNVLINGVSIGGGDEVAELDVKRTLIDKIKDLGGKRMTIVQERPAEEEVREEAHGLR